MARPDFDRAPADEFLAAVETEGRDTTALRQSSEQFMEEVGALLHGASR